MIGHSYQAKARPLAPNLYEVTSPDFPEPAIRIQAPDGVEALTRAMPWLVGRVVGRFQDGRTA